MDRTGSRLISLFQSLEKLAPGRADSAGGASCSHISVPVGRYSSDDIQQLRYLSSKVLQYITSQDKEHRDLVLKNPDYIDCLLRVLESSGDKVTSYNLVCVFGELVLRLSSSKRLSLFVSHGATQVLLHVLVSEAKNDDCSPELLITIHQLLSKLGPRDRKFGVKARLYQALGVSLGLVRGYINSHKVLQPVIHVVKIYAADAVNASYLGKNGLVTYLFKIFALCQRKHLVLLKNALDTFGLLVKSKSNAVRAVSLGGVQLLLTMYTEWHKIDSRNRHISLRKSVLNAVKNLTEIKAGRLALMEADGIRLLYGACQETIDCRELENIIFQASLIMRKCFPKNRLPVVTLRSPLSFPIPDSELYGASVALADDENEYDSSLENDDDDSSDDDLDNRRMDSDDDMDMPTMGGDTSYRRSWEELSMYKEFFAELFEFDSILQDADPSYRPITGPASVSSSALSTCCQSILPPQPPPNGPLLRGTQSLGGIQSVDRSSTPSLTSQNVSRRPSVGVGASKGGSNQSRLTVGHASNSSMLADGIIGTKLSGARIAAENALDASSKAGNRMLQLSTASLGRSPKARRKTAKSGKVKEKKKPATVSSAKPSKGKTADDVPKFDFTAAISSLSSTFSYSESTATGASSTAGTGAFDLKTTNDASDDDDNGPSSGINLPIIISTDAGDLPNERVEDSELYIQLATQTKSIGRFNKLAYPDLFGHLVTPFRESFYEKKFGIQRTLILQDIDRFINPDQVINRVVYDLDDVVDAFKSAYTSDNSYFHNSDEQRINSKQVSSDCLEFNAQFESGNLRKAIQVRRYEYDLILNPDTNMNHHHQWFYFEVSNVEAGVPYRFNIINCEKVNSQFNFGMRPVMFSVAEALQGRPYWYRVGTKICYYKNHFVRSTLTTGGARGKTYYTATFTVTFKHDRDICYMAYHYPYTYTMLQYHLYKLEKEYDSENIYYRNQTLCETLSGNSVPLVTVTSHPATYDKEGIEQMKNRPYVFLTSRVHPGESNASWVMKGTLEYLLSDKPGAQTLRDMFIFKIVPMLNPDGVINGNHRCSLVAEDLNRRWYRPCPARHPTIYHTKGLMQYLQLATGKGPFVFCDYHGHSRRKNVFLYGCSPCMSWISEDVDNPTLVCKGVEDPGYKMLPKLLHQTAPSFSLTSCSFVVEKFKESTARVVVWRQLGVVRSYTMESSYCGCDQGVYKGQHLNTVYLEEMGAKFAEALAKVRSRPLRLMGSTASGGNLLPVPPSGELDDEFTCLDASGSSVDIRQVAADSGGSSSYASGDSDREEVASDAADDIENDGQDDEELL